MDPLPYNVTISSQSPVIIYNPSRDVNDTREGGWNVSYTRGTTQTSAGKQGVGESYCQTTHYTASLAIKWVGTAAYLYGNSTRSSYAIEIDGAGIQRAEPDSNLLVSVTDLPYGSHIITLTHNDESGTDELAIHYAILTIGVGHEGSSPKNRTVPAIRSDALNDQFFTFRRPTLGTGWSMGSEYIEILPNGDSLPAPRLVSGRLESTVGPSLVFRVTNASALFMRGLVGLGRTPKSVTLMPGLNGETSKVTVFNDYSPIFHPDQVLYWECGLVRDQTYTVELCLAEGSPPSDVDFHTLDIIDGGSKPNSDSTQNGTPSFGPDASSSGPETSFSIPQTFSSGRQTSAPGSETSSLGPVGPTREPVPNQQVKRQLSAGSTAGIAVGIGLAVIIMLTTSVLCLLRRRRRDRAALVIADASNITAFVGTKSDPQRAGSGPRSKRNAINEPESEGAPSSSSSESIFSPNSPPSVSASVTRRALRHLRGLRFTSPPLIRETDAGPATFPPEYDDSWAANGPAPPQRRVFSVPPGLAPPSQVERNEEAVNAS